MFDRSIIYNYSDYYKLYKSLASPHYLIKLLNERINRFNPNVLIDGDNLIKLEIGLSYIIYNLQNEKSTLDINRVILLRNTLFDEFCKHKFISSELFIFQNGIKELLFTSDQLSVINKFLEDRSMREQNAFFKFENGTITQRDFEHLLIIAQSWLNNLINEEQEEKCDKFYEYIIKSGKAKLSLVELEFIAKYTNYLVSKDLKIPIHPIVFSDYHLETGEEMPDGVGAYSTDGSGIIHINRKRARENKVLPLFSNMHIDYCTDLIHQIGHESRHTSQDYRSRNYGYLDMYAFDHAVYAIIRKYEPSDFERNYASQQIEIDAEIYGWSFARTQIKKHNPTKYSEIEELARYAYQTTINKTLVLKKDEEGKHYQLDYFDLVKLDEIIAQHPEELKHYPVLTYFYDKKGHRKSYFENNSNYFTMDKVYFKNIKTRFLKVDIFCNNYLKDLDKYNLSLPEKRELYHGLFDILVINYNNILGSITALERDDSKIKQFSILNKRRIQESLEIWDYINCHKSDMNITDSALIAVGEKSLILSRLKRIYENYVTLSNKIENSLIIETTPIVVWFDKLSEYDYDSAAHFRRG